MTPPTRVLVTGARGQLAGAIIEMYSRVADVVACSREELDIADRDAVMSRVEADLPDLIINCAAYNHVDVAEAEPVAALTANAFGVKTLARAARETGVTLVHYSTDFVFDGRTSTPYTEQDVPNPLGVYAASKLIGEWFATEAPNGLVLRVESLFGGQPAKSSIDRIIQSINSGAEAKVFVDRIVSPSYVEDVAQATRALVNGGHSGLYHCVSTGYCSWYELAQEIAHIMGKQAEARLVPVSVNAIHLRAPRPTFAALSNDKLHRVLPVPTWQDALRRHLA